MLLACCFVLCRVQASQNGTFNFNQSATSRWTSPLTETLRSASRRYCCLFPVAPAFVLSCLAHPRPEKGEEGKKRLRKKLRETA
ncbi:hypothetical protein HDK77DRAFT_235323 [Phyllosticta capitalensis]